MTRFKLAAADTFRSMRHRNFRLFFFGQMISQVGNWLTMMASGLLVLHITDNSGIAIGVLVACQFGPVLLFGAWGGVVADRMDRRKLLITVQTLAMLQSFVLAALAFSGNPPVVAIYGVAVLGGVCTAFDSPVRRSFVTDMVPLDEVQNAVSLNSAMMTSARIVGPALAGLLIDNVGFGWCFLVDGLSYIAVIGGLLAMRRSELQPAVVAVKAKGQIREAMRYVRSEPDLWIPMLMLSVVGTLAFNFNVLLPLYVYKALHSTQTIFTVMYSVVSVGAVVAALVTARRRTATVRHVIIGSILFGIAELALAAAPGLPVAFPVALAVGYSSMLFMAASTAIVQIVSVPEMRGRVMALQAILFIGSAPLGGPLMGFISDTIGPRMGFVVGAAACLSAAWWGVLAQRRRHAALAPRAQQLGLPSDAAMLPIRVR